MVHLKYVQFLYVYHTLTKLGKNLTPKLKKKITKIKPNPMSSV